MAQRRVDGIAAVVKTPRYVLFDAMNEQPSRCTSRSPFNCRSKLKITSSRRHTRGDADACRKVSLVDGLRGGVYNDSHEERRRSAAAGMSIRCIAFL